MLKPPKTNFRPHSNQCIQVIHSDIVMCCTHTFEDAGIHLIEGMRPLNMRPPNMEPKCDQKGSLYGPPQLTSHWFHMLQLAWLQSLSDPCADSILTTVYKSCLTLATRLKEYVCLWSHIEVLTLKTRVIERKSNVIFLDRLSAIDSNNFNIQRVPLYSDYNCGQSDHKWD